jgi:hypothetical protein
MQLAAIVDRGVAQVIAGVIKIGRYCHVLHYSKLSIAGFTVTFIDLIDGPLKGFSDFGRDFLKGGCSIVINFHYNITLEPRKLALSNADNAIKSQIVDCWLILFDNLDLVWRAFSPNIAVTRVNISLQVTMSCVILQSFVVPEESVWCRQQRWHFVDTEAIWVATTTALSHNLQLNRQLPTISEASNSNYVGLGKKSEERIAVASNQTVVG